jgi:hypothetical protein
MTTPSREQIAKIIDPDPWECGTNFGQRLLTANMYFRREDSLRKADAIIAALVKVPA